MANLNVSYDQMQSEASNLRAKKDTINSELQGMQRRIEGLVSGGFVTDAASGAFNTMYQNFTRGATQTIDALDQISQALDKMVSTLQETDQQLASGLGG